MVEPCGSQVRGARIFQLLHPEQYRLRCLWLGSEAEVNWSVQRRGRVGNRLRSRRPYGVTHGWVTSPTPLAWSNDSKARGAFNSQSRPKWTGTCRARAKTFVAHLFRLSDVVLFSAPMSHKGRTGHLNRPSLESWAIYSCQPSCGRSKLCRDPTGGHRRGELWPSRELIIFCKEVL